MPSPASPLIDALHRAARRWCMERHAEWSRAYAALQAEGRGYDPTSGRYSRAALRIFPRYQQLAAMLVEIERFSPEDFASLDEARELVCAAGDSARSPYLASASDPLVEEAVAEERAQFCAHVAGLDDDLLWREPPLAFRRVLTEREASRWSEALEAAYGRWCGGVPDRPCARPNRTYALDRVPEPALRRLRAMVADRSPRVFERNEADASYLLDASLAALTRCESFTFDASLGWMIYASHEGTLTVAGSLVTAVEAELPELAACALPG